MEAADAGGRAPLPGAAGGAGLDPLQRASGRLAAAGGSADYSVYFYDAAGQEIAKSDFGWYLFPPDSTVNVAVTFQDGREHTVDQVVLFLYPTGTGVAEERQQIGVRRIRDGRTFALFRWQIPASLYSHLEVQLECGDGQTISVSQWNVIDRDSAF